MRYVNKHTSMLLKSLAVVASLAFISACDNAGKPQAGATGKAADAQPRVAGNSAMEALYQRAKEEGTVIYWTPTETELETKVAAAFNKAYPGIKVVPFSIKPGNAVERITSEAQAGRVSVDLLSSSLASSAPLLDRGLVAPFDGFDEMPPLVKNSLLIDAKFLNNYNLDFVIGYNTSIIPEAIAPRTWDDLLKPELKGKIAIEARAMPFGYLGVAWGEAKLVAYLDKLRAQQPFFVKGGNTLADQVASGEAPVAIGTYSYQIELMKSHGAPADYKIPDTLGISNFGNLLIKGAAHPNAAKLYAAWMASEEGQGEIVKLFGRGSLLPDSPREYAQKIRNSGAVMVFDSVENAKPRKKMEDIAAKRLGVHK